MFFRHGQSRKDDTSGNCGPLNQPLQDVHNGSDDFSTGNGDVSWTSITHFYDEETRFELLSAYMDDEVTSEERQLVTQWIKDDPVVQQMYQQLLMLRQAIRRAPIPMSETSVLKVPTPGFLGKVSLSVVLWTVAGTTAIALLGGLSQLSTSQGRQRLQQSWHFMKHLPQLTLFGSASNIESSIETARDVPVQ
ncbi:MAG: hypothetical protein AAF821_00820 [Cyanobacteria bacterium P01_D01_bin.156]